MPPTFQPRREIGRTGFRATILGIGDLADRSVPLADCVATIRRAMDAGLNVIDTAPAYENGYSEEIVGAALKGRRQGMFVIDKVDHMDRPVAPQVDGSLGRLGLEATDLFVFHGVSEPSVWKALAAPGGGMEQLAECLKAGKARFRGISSHHPEVLRAAIESGLVDVVLFAVGPVLRPAVPRRNPATGQKQRRRHRLLQDLRGRQTPGRHRGLRPAALGPAARQVQFRRPRCGGNPALPHLAPAECLRYTLTCDPDVALLGLSFPNEQDAAFRGRGLLQADDRRRNGRPPPPRRRGRPGQRPVLVEPGDIGFRPSD